MDARELDTINEIEKQIDPSLEPHFISQNEAKDNSLLINILAGVGIAVIAVGSLIWFMQGMQKKVSLSGSESAIVSPTPETVEVQLTTQYTNPFDTSTQYTNPFDNTNPFNNLSQ